MIKVMIVVSILTTIFGCPNEPNCNKCGENDKKGKCEFCYRGFLDKESACTLTQKQDKIDNCVMYQPISISFESPKIAACKKCEYGHFLEEGICKKCKISGCAVCSREDDCSACFKGKQVVTVETVEKVEKVWKCSDLESDVPNCEICQYSLSKPEFQCLKCKSTFALNEKALAKSSCHSAKVKTVLFWWMTLMKSVNFVIWDFILTLKEIANQMTGLIGMDIYGFGLYWCLLLGC